MNARLLAWPEKFPRLWCRTCQSYRAWYERGERVRCTWCDRVLIAEPANGVSQEEPA